MTKLTLYPDEIISQANGMNLTLANQNSRLHTIEIAISEFVNNEELTGKGWSSLKQQFLNHISVIHGIICANEEIIAANESLKSMVGTEVLDEEEIERDIRSTQYLIYGYSAIIEGLKFRKNITLFPVVSYDALINNYNYMIETLNTLILMLEAKLDKLRNIEIMTRELFTSTGSLFSSVEQGIQMLQGDWRSKGYNFTMDFGWKSKLDSSWKKRGEVKDLRAVQDYLKEKLGDELLTYEALEKLSEEQQHVYVETLSKQIFEYLPNMKLGVGEGIEIPIGMGITFYYNIKGEVGTSENPAEIAGIIENHKVVLESISVATKGGEVGFNPDGAPYYKIGNDVGNNTTVGLSIEIDQVSLTIKVENSVTTTLETISIESITGIKKDIQGNDDKVSVPAVEEKQPYKLPSFEMRDIPLTSDDGGILGEIAVKIQQIIDRFN